MAKRIEKSYIELFFHEFWLPEWQVIKIKNYIYSIENTESFCKTIGLGQNSDLASINIYLMIEIIASTMVLIESLATVMESIMKNPRNLQNGFKVANPTRFYKSIDSLNYDDYLKILSAPTRNSLCNAKICDLNERLDNFGKMLIEFKKYYFNELDLYNSYKHGFRLFLTETYQGDNNYIDTLAYFSQSNKLNELQVRCLESDSDKHLKMAEKTVKLLRTIISNHKNMADNPENYQIMIPEG